MAEELDVLSVSSADYGPDFVMDAVRTPKLEEEDEFGALVPKSLNVYQRLLLRKENFLDKLRSRRMASNIIPEEEITIPCEVPTQGDDVMRLMAAKVAALEELEKSAGIVKMEEPLEDYIEQRHEPEGPERKTRLEIINRMKHERDERTRVEEELIEQAAMQREEEIIRLQDEQLRLKKARIREEKVKEYYRTHGGVQKVEQLREELPKEKPVKLVFKKFEAVEEQPAKPRVKPEFSGVSVKKIKLR